VGVCTFKVYGGESLKCIQPTKRTTMNSEKKTEIIHARISFDLRHQMNTLILAGPYKGESQFVREAIEEKIKRGE